MRLEIGGPATTSPTSLAISPDGLQVVYVAELDQRPQLWIRRLDSGAARPLPGTDYPQFPFWSPDSKSLGFFGGGKLKRLDIAGGSPKDLADAPQGYGGAWNKGGTIIFCANNRDLFRISAEGGEADTTDAPPAPPANVPSSPMVPAGWSSLPVLCDRP